MQISEVKSKQISEVKSKPISEVKSKKISEVKSKGQVHVVVRSRVDVEEDMANERRENHTLYVVCTLRTLYVLRVR